jgi:hypothetical protein
VDDCKIIWSMPRPSYGLCPLGDHPLPVSQPAKGDHLQGDFSFSYYELVSSFFRLIAGFSYRRSVRDDVWRDQYGGGSSDGDANVTSALTWCEEPMNGDDCVAWDKGDGTNKATR